MAWSYVDYGHLAREATWFKNLWHLVHTFEAELTFREEDLLHGVRENDCKLMLEFHWVGYRGQELAALNVVRCFRHLIHLSDISKCNGILLDEFMILDSTELSTEYRFPWEEPTSLDFCLWKDAIRRLCSGTLMLL